MEPASTEHPPPEHATADRVAALTPLIDRWLAYQQWYRQIPSLAVGLAVGGRTVYAAGHGWADEAGTVPAGPHTRYRVASHSKVFTATALMGLVADGIVRLDDPVSQHLDWFRSDAQPDLARVTLRQLLSHSGGLTRDGVTTHWHDGRFPDLSAIRAQVDALAVVGPVRILKYSNIAYTVLGQVIEAATGVPYEDHLTRTVLEPLGLSHTTPDLPELSPVGAGAAVGADPGGGHAVGWTAWRPDRPRQPLPAMSARVMNSATGFSSTVTDLLRWYQAHELGSGELFDDRHKREMQRLQFEGPDLRWGIGFQLASIHGLDFRAHGGGYPGYISYSGFNPDHRLALVVLTSAIDGPAGELFAGVVGLIKRALDGAFAPAEEGTPFDEAAVDGIVGFYPSWWRDTLVARVGERVVVGPAHPLDPAATLQVLEPMAPAPGPGLHFRYPHAQPIASPGEELWFEPGRPPRLHAPSQPPVARTDPWD